MAARQTVKITKKTVTTTKKRGVPALVANVPKAPASTGGGKKRGRPKGSKDTKPRKKRS